MASLLELSKDLVMAHASTTPMTSKEMISEIQDDTGETLPAVTVDYGAFINTIVELFLVALTLFMVVKLMNRLIRRRENEVTP